MARQSPIPKADAQVMRSFEALLPDDPGIVVHPMFGQRAAFVNGNMFAGTFGEDVFVRLDEGSRAELLAVTGAKRFEPMKGRPMVEYVQIPRKWIAARTEARSWVARALDHATTLPPKSGTKSGRKPASKSGAAGRVSPRKKR